MNYHRQYQLPIQANSQLEKEIHERLNDCLEKEDYIGAIYYLNLCYNYTDEKTNDAVQIDAMIDALLDKIEW